MFFDIHSHIAFSTNDHWFMQNLTEGFDSVENEGIYSIGLHPWFINEKNWHGEFELLQKYATNNFVAAIGECGLDKICRTDFKLQQKVFEAQIKFANEIKKPLIIHCVRAYEEVIQLLKINNNIVPVIFHGFNRNEQIAKWLINEGYFLSFGKELFKESTKAFFKKLPLERIFFETDNSSVSIKEIYLTAEALLQLDAQSLQLQIKKNAVNVFGDGLFIR